MKAILMKVVAPFAAVGAAIGAVATAATAGWISDETAFWLWPTLIAVLFLAFSIVSLLRRAWLWLWPLGSGLVAQTVGTLLLLSSGVFGDNRWKPLWYTLLTVGLVLLVMGIVWLVSTIRARALERVVSQEGGGIGEDLGRIREDMREAVDRFRRAGRGRNAIYELPWFLVMGRPAAGKTVAIKNSELGLPVKRDWAKGRGGTYTADWFFTNELIFVDTPGRWVTESASDDDKERWRELMRQLRKYRGRQPLEGLIVVVPADDLLSLEDEDLEEQASNVREVVELIHEELQFRFPVYLLISKCDLVDGFVDFFKQFPARRRHEIFGWSNEDPNEKDVVGLLARGFRKVHRRLVALRPDMLARVAKKTQTRKLFFFPEEFRTLERPLGVFAEAFFQAGHFAEPPVFRGFYFTSGTQEGAPLSRAMGSLAKALGVSAAKSGEAGEEEAKRSYFLLDLFRDLMVGDEGLVGRTTRHWWRLRRNTAFGVFAPAGLAVLILLLSGLALILNKRTYARAATNAPRHVQALAGLQSKGGPPWKDEVEQALEQTGSLMRYHDQMAGFSPFRGFGMRRPGELATESRELFREAFVDAVLRPTLSEAALIAQDANESCPERIDVLRSVVWLRTGKRAGFEQLAGLDRVWGLAASADAARAAAVRKDLRRQYGYYLNQQPGDLSQTDLLPGFDVRRVADSIVDDCGNQGDRSTLAAYDRFQKQCRDATGIATVRECYAGLNEVLNRPKLDWEGFRDRLTELNADLEKLAGPDMPEADTARKSLGRIDISVSEREEESRSDKGARCLENFETEILPEIQTFAVRGDFLKQCRDAVQEESRIDKKIAVRDEMLTGKAAELKEVGEELEELMAVFNVGCRSAVEGFRKLDFDLLSDITLQYHRNECFPPEVGRKARPAPVEARTSRKARPTPPAPPSYTWFVSPKVPSAVYRPAAWEQRRQVWAARWQSAENAGAAREAEQQQVRGEVRGYASGYSKAWIDYLKSLELKRDQGVPSSWLRFLADTKEYARLVGRVTDNARLAGTDAPPFDVVPDEIETLEGVASLDLATYQKLLREVSDDLLRCEKDDVAWQQYKSSLAQGSRDNSLVRARDWVASNAGPTFVDGALTDLFEAPLDVAESFVNSQNLLRGQWTALTRQYESGIAGKAPFAGGLKADEAAKLEDVRALLGGESGAVARLRQSAAERDLKPEAAAWLSRAERLSKLLFEEGSDAPRDIELLVEVQDPVYEENFDKKRQLQAVTIFLAPGAKFSCDIEEPEVGALEITLFGSGASDYSHVNGTVAEKTNVAIRAFKKWKDGEQFTAVSESGEPAEIKDRDLAPLRLLALGLEGGEGGNQLRYAIEVQLKGDKVKRVHVPMTLSGRDADALIELIRDGLPPPPREVLEEGG